MLNKMARGMLVVTSTAPILLTYSFMLWVEKKSVFEICRPILIAILLVVLCMSILKFSTKYIQVTPFHITSIKSTDSGVISFFIAYLMPLVTVSTKQINHDIVTFIIVLMAFITWTTNSYSINPLLCMVGYHFYEVETRGNVICLLISKKILINKSDITQVVKLSEYIALDIGGSNV